MNTRTVVIVRNPQTGQFGAAPIGMPVNLWRKRKATAVRDAERLAKVMRATVKDMTV